MAFSLSSGRATAGAYGALCELEKVAATGSVAWEQITGLWERRSFLQSAAPVSGHDSVSVHCAGGRLRRPVQPGTLVHTHPAQSLSVPPPWEWGPWGWKNQRLWLKETAPVATGLSFLYQGEWPFICRVKLRYLSDSVSPVYRPWFLMNVRGAKTYWFYRLID